MDCFIVVSVVRVAVRSCSCNDSSHVATTPQILTNGYWYIMMGYCHEIHVHTVGTHAALQYIQRSSVEARLR